MIIIIIMIITIVIINYYIYYISNTIENSFLLNHNLIMVQSNQIIVFECTQKPLMVIFLWHIVATFNMFMFDNFYTFHSKPHYFSNRERRTIVLSSGKVNFMAQIHTISPHFPRYNVCIENYMHIPIRNDAMYSVIRNSYQWITINVGNQ